MKNLLKTYFCISTLMALMNLSYAGCNNDYDCEFGNKCVKPEGSYSLEGLCVTPTKNGVQDYSQFKRGIKPHEVKRCSFDTECGVGGSCIKKDSSIYGICVH